MNYRFALVIAVLAFACGKKAEKAPATGSATSPHDAAAAPIADASAIAIDAETGSASGSATASGSASGSASGALDLCTVPNQKDVLDLVGQIPEGEKPNPARLPPGADGVVGCSYELVNRYVTLEAKPLADFDEKPAKYKKELKGLGEKAFALDGTVTVKLAGKPWILRVHADAGERNPDDRLAERFAKLVLAGLK
jgi:hypothetical protein